MAVKTITLFICYTRFSDLLLLSFNTKAILQVKNLNPHCEM